MQVTHIHAYVLQETSSHDPKPVSKKVEGESDVEKDGEEEPTDDRYNDDHYVVKLLTLHLVQYTACSFHMAGYIYIYICCLHGAMVLLCQKEEYLVYEDEDYDKMEPREKREQKRKDRKSHKQQGKEKRKGDNSRKRGNRKDKYTFPNIS